jgi:RNA polymerase sigma-70 factor (ECF subfamily)
MDDVTFSDAAQRHLDDVHRYLVFLTGDRVAAEDLTAETFERALRAWHRFDAERGSAKTWLCTIARSSALDWFRAEERRRRREDAYARAGDVYEDARFSEGFSPALAEALVGVSAAEREVVALCVVLELDRAAAARVLGISETACTTRLSRALKKLEERMTADVHA